MSIAHYYFIVVSRPDLCLAPWAQVNLIGIPAVFQNVDIVTVDRACIGAADLELPWINILQLVEVIKYVLKVLVLKLQLHAHQVTLRHSLQGQGTRCIEVQGCHRVLLLLGM